MDVQELRPADPVRIALKSQDQIDEDVCLDVCGAILNELGIAALELSVVVAKAQEIRQLNLAHRGRDHATDVLSFPQISWESPLTVEERQANKVLCRQLNETGRLLLGDVVICPELARANARSIGHSLERELSFLLIHGILHLCGHDHMDAVQEERMIEQQKKLITTLAESMGPKGRPRWTGLTDETNGDFQ